MASETGHAKNVANIDKVLDLVTQFGAIYNPTNPQLTPTGLKALKIKCNSDYSAWIAALTNYKNATNDRELAFEPLDKLCTSISDNVKTLDVPQQTIDDVKAIVSKIHGNGKLTKADAGRTTNPTNPAVPDPNAPTTISTSQQSYDSIYANFDKLVQLLITNPSYAPNETKIKIATLTALSTSLSTINLVAITATNTYNLSRNQRNLTFYATQTGLCDIMKKVKLYTRQIYGSQSAEYHQMTAIKFVKFTTKKKTTP